MQIIKTPILSPEENIAIDEFLLKKAEDGEIGENVRLWSYPRYFIVLGRTSKVLDDCFLGSCHKNNIKIIRRISGGGTVLEGPGCLNFSAILSYESDPAYKNINSSYKKILEKISIPLKFKGLDVSFLPLADLAIGGKKISGNAQARKRKFFLHHGTFFYDFDIPMIKTYLKHPKREPGYRRGRSHENFLANTTLTKQELEEMITNVFSPGIRSFWEPSVKDFRELGMLVSKKFASDKWNYCF